MRLIGWLCVIAAGLSMILGVLMKRIVIGVLCVLLGAASAHAGEAKNAMGTVKSVSVDSFVVAGKDAEWTFALHRLTAIRKSGKAITGADLKPGDLVWVRYRDYEGKATAMAVQVNPRTASDARDRETKIRAYGWPKNIESAVIERRVIVGMTSEQVILAWGQPGRVNETTYAWGSSEQWVYSGRQYVYFRNGKVTAIQTSR